MAIATDIRKTLADSTPFHAVVGAGDLAVEKIRGVPEQVAGIAAKAPKLDVAKLKATKIDVPKFEMPKFDVSAVPTDPKVIREKVAGTANDVQDFAKTQYGKARVQVEAQYGKAGDYAERLREIYAELAARGQKIVEERLGAQDDAVAKPRPAVAQPPAAAKPATKPATEPAAEPAPKPAKPAARKAPAKRPAKKTPPPAE